MFQDMIAEIRPSGISGIVQASPSKSAMQRACAAALLKKGTTIIHNPGHCNDDKAALRIIESLGARLEIKDKFIQIYSDGIDPATTKFCCGESGLAIRMFTPIASLSNQAMTISGEGSLLSRPMHFFNAVLPQLNVSISSDNGKLPLRIQGPLQPKNIEVNGAVSSQFLTGILFAYSAADAKDISVRVKELTSKPYIDLTLEVMKDFGLKVPENRNYAEFYFDNRTILSARSDLNYTIEGDWSGAAFILVAAAISGSITVSGLRNHSSQADEQVMEVLRMTGAAIHVTDNAISVTKKELHPFDFDATDCPDLFPPLVALAANCKGLSIIRGLKRLRYKESDRGKTLQQEFYKLGTRIELNGDEMQIYGNRSVVVNNPSLDAHNDHRIAMACAVGGLNANVPVTIRGADAIEKSYPDFWEHLRQLHAHVNLKF